MREQHLARVTDVTVHLLDQLFARAEAVHRAQERHELDGHELVVAVDVGIDQVRLDDTLDLAAERGVVADRDR